MMDDKAVAVKLERYDCDPPCACRHRPRLTKDSYRRHTGCCGTSTRRTSSSKAFVRSTTLAVLPNDT